MSREEELQLIEDFARQWNDHGVAGIAHFFHPDVVWIDPPELPGGGTHNGRDATTTFLREWGGGLGLRLAFEMEQIIPLDSGYLAISLRASW